MKKRVDIDDFPPEAKALLRDLSRAEIKSLAIQAGSKAIYVEDGDFTTDPTQGAREALAALKRQVEVEVDDGLTEIAYSLRIAVNLLGSENDCDDEDGRALAWLLSRAETILTQEARALFEAERRLNRCTGGLPLNGSRHGR